MAFCRPVFGSRHEIQGARCVITVKKCEELRIMDIFWFIR